MLQIDPYMLEKKLGSGNFGDVYYTTKKDTDAVYATKKIEKRKVDRGVMKTYFLNEIDILKSTDHENLIKLYEIKSSKNNFYMIMEYLNGGNLAEAYMKYFSMHHKPLPEIYVQHILRGMAKGVYYLHKNEIIHRDLKLENILFNYENQEDLNNFNMLKTKVKIIDFGFSKFLKAHDSDSICGSPINMDPSILKALAFKGNDMTVKYNLKADMWSIGIIVYFLLIGNQPFEGQSFTELFKKINNGEYKIPKNLKLSKQAISVINGLLMFETDDRLSAFDLLYHEFLTKKIEDFDYIDLNMKTDMNQDIIMNNKAGINKIWEFYSTSNNENISNIKCELVNESFLVELPKRNDYFQAQTKILNNNNDNYFNNYHNPIETKTNLNTNIVPNNIQINNEVKAFNNNTTLNNNQKYAEVKTINHNNTPPSNTHNYKVESFKVNDLNYNNDNQMNNNNLYKVDSFKVNDLNYYNDNQMNNNNNYRVESFKVNDLNLNIDNQINNNNLYKVDSFKVNDLNLNNDNQINNNNNYRVESFKVNDLNLNIDNQINNNYTHNERLSDPYFNNNLNTNTITNTNINSLNNKVEYKISTPITQINNQQNIISNSTDIENIQGNIAKITINETNQINNNYTNTNNLPISNYQNYNNNYLNNNNNKEGNTFTKIQNPLTINSNPTDMISAHNSNYQINNNTQVEVNPYSKNNNFSNSNYENTNLSTPQTLKHFSTPQIKKQFDNLENQKQNLINTQERSVKSVYVPASESTQTDNKNKNEYFGNYLNQQPSQTQRKHTDDNTVQYNNYDYGGTRSRAISQKILRPEINTKYQNNNYQNNNYQNNSNSYVFSSTKNAPIYSNSNMQDNSNYSGATSYKAPNYGNDNNNYNNDKNNYYHKENKSFISNNNYSKSNINYANAPQSTEIKSNNETYSYPNKNLIDEQISHRFQENVNSVNNDNQYNNNYHGQYDNSISPLSTQRYIPYENSNNINYSDPNINKNNFSANVIVSANGNQNTTFHSSSPNISNFSNENQNRIYEANSANTPYGNMNTNFQPQINTYISKDYPYSENKHSYS